MIIDYSKLSPSDADFTARQKEGQIKVSPFGKDPNSKYISTVSDSEITLEENSRFKYLATYISNKDKIVGIKVQKFEKKDGELQPGSFVNLQFKQANSLANFLKFLLEANLGTLASGKFVLADDLSLDPDIYSKLITLSGDINGKGSLMKLFDSGYLTEGLDVSDLIKRGLSQNKIEEKFNAINEFEKLINETDVKEVSGIQSYLTRIPWIFGPEYVSLDVRDAGDAGIPDFRLKRIDGLSDILEVKLPNVELLRKDKIGRHFIAPDLSEALGQLTGYLEHFYSLYTEEKDDTTGKEILEDRYGKYYKPRGILLIGRRKTAEGIGVKQTDDARPKHLRRLLSYFHWVEVLTYDDLIERARNGLNNLTSK